MKFTHYDEIRKYPKFGNHADHIDAFIYAMEHTHPPHPHRMRPTRGDILLWAVAVILILAMAGLFWLPLLFK